MIYFVIFLVAVFLNLYITVFGKSDIEMLKEKMSIREYLKELDECLTETLGEKGTTTVILTIVGLSVAIVLVNALFFLGCLVAVLLGMFAARLVYKVPFSSNLINKLATYINRLRN